MSERGSALALATLTYHGERLYGAAFLRVSICAISHSVTSLAVERARRRGARCARRPRRSYSNADEFFDTCIQCKNSRFRWHWFSSLTRSRIAFVNFRLVNYFSAPPEFRTLKSLRARTVSVIQSSRLLFRCHLSLPCGSRYSSTAFSVSCSLHPIESHQGRHEFRLAAPVFAGISRFFMLQSDD